MILLGKIRHWWRLLREPATGGSALPGNPAGGPPQARLSVRRATIPPKPEYNKQAKGVEFLCRCCGI